MASKEQDRHGEHRAQQVVVAAALAAHLFRQPREAGQRPVARVRDMMFLLSGQVSAWSRWPELSIDDQRLIGDLLRHRDPDMANETVVRRVIQAGLDGHPVRLPDGVSRIDAIELSAPPDVLLAAGLEALRKASTPTTKSTPVAQDGSYVATPFRGRGVGLPGSTVHYTLKSLPVLDTPSPTEIGDPAAADTLAIPVEELREIARRLDTADAARVAEGCEPSRTDDLAQRGERSGYRVASLNKIFDNLQTSGGATDAEVWRLAAGPLQVLHAPTGFGKSVLTELVACWCAQHGRVMTVLVATNAAVIRTAYAIDQHLRTLGIDGGAVPLTSPSAAQTEAEKVITANPEHGGIGHWAMERMGYGCALVGAANESATEAWVPGDEPCTRLRPAGEERPRAHRCPWLGSCGKFNTVRQAAIAPVIVTSFGNWQRGTIRVPISVSGRVIDGMRVEELLMRRSDLILIDEVDEFQADMIKNAAGQVLLAHEKPTLTPLQRISEELNRHKRQLTRNVRRDAHYASALTRTLAESYVNHLADGDFHSIRAQRGNRHPLLDRWLLPERWDRELVDGLFRRSEATPPPSPDEWRFFHALYPDRDAEPDQTLPGWMGPIREALNDIRTIEGADPFEESRSRIIAALEQRPGRKSGSDDTGSSTTGQGPQDDAVHDRISDQLIRRAYLTKLQQLLTQFIYVGPNLVDAGVISAAVIADELGTYKAWRAAPFGPLGHTLFAFSENYDPDHADETALAANAIGGDPHEYVRSIGETTALALLRRRRCVVGLSATSYFPGAVHHHVMIEPTWWVTDDLADGDIELFASPVTDDELEQIRISGTSGWQRRLALRTLGANLYRKQLRAELENLANNPETAARARLMLATTSYEGAEDLALGLRAAGVPPEQIVLAVPPVKSAPSGSGLATSPSGEIGPNWRALPGGELEKFGENPAEKFLIAPLARAGRGINIVGEDSKSLIGSIWMVVRPIPIIDQPAEILAHAHAGAKAAQRPGPDPDEILAQTGRAAARTFNALFTSLPYFSALPEPVQQGIVAETLVGLIQLAGRGRRGGTTARIHLVDYAFFDPATKTDLASLVEDLVTKWASTDNGRPLALVESLYGKTLQTIRDFAAEQREAFTVDEEEDPTGNAAD